MLTVFLGAVVSLGIALFGISVILSEVRSRAGQIMAALSFEQRAFLNGDFRPAVMPRQVRLASVRIQPRTARRAAA